MNRTSTFLLPALIAPMLAFTQGCVPSPVSYLRIEAAEGKHFKSTCIAPDILYYPFHEIFISISAQPVSMRLHLPVGTTAQLDGDRVKFIGSTKDGPTQQDIQIKAMPQEKIISLGPPEWRKLPDPYNSNTTTLGTLVGASSNGYNRWYLFLGEDPRHPGVLVNVSRDFLEGTVELPPMTVNGVRYPSQNLPVKRNSYVTVIPVNGC